MTECMATSIGNVAEAFGETTDYAVLEDYTLQGWEKLEDVIKTDQQEIETMEDLVEHGYVENQRLDQYPENCRIASSGL